MKLFYPFIFALFLFSACDNETSTTTTETETTPEEAPLSLPMKSLELKDMSAFQANEAWEIVGNVASDFQKEGDYSSSEGTGILVSKVSEAGDTPNLSTAKAYGDLDLELDFWLPKGGEGTILFQGQYAINLNDSWGKGEPFCGHINGQSSKANTCKAPGLWQTLTASFVAPRFNENGEKTSNAHFEEVSLNGFPLFKDVDLEGENEVAEAPLVLASKMGNIAFKNIRYKNYGRDSLRLENIKYTIYQGDWDVLPDFEGLEASGSGETDMLDPNVAGQADKFALKFTGDLYVPTDGEYWIQSSIDDGGDIIIDSVLVLHNDGEPNEGTERTVTTLTAGKHDFEMTYFQDHWGRMIIVNYEGPEIKKQFLATKDPAFPWLRETYRPLNPKDKSELLRCFANYDGVKRTHVMAVGNPSGVHYLYDLNESALLRVWHGDFADVAKMWDGRGQTQLMEPENAVAELTDGVPVAQLTDINTAWPEFTPSSYKFKGYELNEKGQPTYQYEIYGKSINDFSSPSDSGNAMNRTISGEGMDGLYCRLASAEEITEVGNGYYNVGGDYYIKVLDAGDVSLRNSNELVAAFSDGKVQYEILW